MVENAGAMVVGNRESRVGACQAAQEADKSARVACQTLHVQIKLYMINCTSGFFSVSDDFGAFLPVDHHELVAGCMARQTPR